MLLGHSGSQGNRGQEATQGSIDNMMKAKRTCAGPYACSHRGDVSYVGANVANVLNNLISCTLMTQFWSSVMVLV